MGKITVIGLTSEVIPVLSNVWSSSNVRSTPDSAIELLVSTTHDVTCSDMTHPGQQQFSVMDIQNLSRNRQHYFQSRFEDSGLLNAQRETYAPH